MIYTQMTIKAMKIAYNAHLDQFDKAGIPYIFHPIHIAEQMTDEISTCVALLHDIIEDTSVTLEDLEKEFPKEVVTAVDLLTREKGVRYFSYIERIKENEIARVVKLADLEHNLDSNRFPIDDSLRDRYLKAKDYLSQ